MSEMSPDDIHAFLRETRIAKLAYLQPDGAPTIVPVWFEWDAGCIWISSFNSTRKNRELAANPRAAVVVDVALDAHRNMAVITTSVTKPAISEYLPGDRSP